MSTEENNQEVVVDTNTNDGEGESESNVIKLDKNEYDKLLTDLGSLKRENKQLKKPKEPTETPQKTNSDDLSSLQERLDKQTLRAANISHEDDVELAKKTAEKWNVSIDDLVSDEDFLAKLTKQQTARANADATSGVKGDQGKVSQKDSPDYWIAKGEAPTREQVPDRKARAKIARAMMADAKSSKTFYND